MEITKKEIELAQQLISEAKEGAIAELSTLQLVLVGGGGGPDVIFG